MIARLVSFALAQRFLVVVGSVALMIWGAIAFQRLPIDAYPDLSHPHVEIVTQWPGHAAEEVERLITIPLEVEMNGIPALESLRSISLYGLSSVQMNFRYGADPYFVRQLAFERIADAAVPSGVTPSLSPLFSPSGLIYRYVLQSPDRSPQELKTIEDWILERRYRSIEGVADDSGFGGTVMQYHVLLDPARLLSYGVTVPSKHPPQLPGLEDPLAAQVGRGVALVVADHELPPGGSCGADHGAGLGDRAGHGLLHQDVCAGLQGRDGLRRVERVGRAHADGVGFHRQQFAEIRHSYRDLELGGDLLCALKLGIAQADDLDILAIGVLGQVAALCDGARPDDGDS
jgi:hypothetical protein